MPQLIPLTSKKELKAWWPSLGLEATCTIFGPAALTYLPVICKFREESGSRGDSPKGRSGLQCELLPFGPDYPIDPMVLEVFCDKKLTYTFWQPQLENYSMGT